MENSHDKSKKNPETPKRKKQEENIDEQLEQTFPASDPPSYSQPGSDRKKNPDKKKQRDQDQ